MKPFILLLLLSGFLSACNPDFDQINECKPTTAKCPQNKSHPKGDSLQKILDKYTGQGIPGAVIAILDKAGCWTGTAGFAQKESALPMSAANLQYGFSITKMVTAVSIMQLNEQGKIRLDAPIKNYLPQNVKTLLPQTHKITVRMLLNHTSGYNDYVRLPEFQERFLQNPLHIWTQAEYFDLMQREVKPQFAPGSDFLYSNVNYYLLALMIDQVTGQPHGKWFKRQVFDRLHLKEIFYKGSTGYPFYNRLPNTYWPRLEDGEIENNTAVQQAWAQGEEYGATGIIASPAAYIALLKGLVDGRLVNAASLAQMRTWVQGKTSSEPDYGLGLCYWGYKGKMQYGHDGDGVGAAANLMYFPVSKTYLFLAANSTTELGANIAETIHNFRNETGNYLASF